MVCPTLLSLILGAIELNRIVLAFRAFFSLVFSGELSAEILIALNLSRRSPAAPAKAAAPAAPAVRASDGALQILGILQRDSRLIDFLMEDVSVYSDDQIGAAVRELHDQCRDAIARYVTLAPVIDGVEGTYAKAPAQDANLVKFVGNVPAKPPAGGTLRHKGWRATKVALPNLAAKQDATIIAPAEIEIEKENAVTELRHRHRSRHHHVGRRLRGNSPRRRPVRASQRRASADSATHQPGRGARRRPAALVPLSPGPERLPGRQPRAPLGRNARLRGGPPGPKARRGERGPPGVLGQELAVALGSRLHRAAAPLPRPGRRGENLARGGQPPLPGPPAAGVGRQDARRAVPGAAGAGHRPRILRRGGARTDTGRRQTGWLREHHAAGRAAGRVLRVAGAPSGLAPAGGGGRPHPEIGRASC